MDDVVMSAVQRVLSRPRSDRKGVDVADGSWASAQLVEAAQAGGRESIAAVICGAHSRVGYPRTAEALGLNNAAMDPSYTDPQQAPAQLGRHDQPNRRPQDPETTSA
ncbi:MULTISPECIES: hypothetical protein [Nonomuraea]|uniref:Uncharacterized protein n=1 Tax=Nonomuraea mangrovi TaxID=2316207 RepID=A0ABW4TAE8_9ACTN